jgi:hypothetical protein
MLLSMCKKLLIICLPKKLQEDILGDLEEEYQQLLTQYKGKNEPKLWLIKQTLLTCTRFIFSPNNFLITLINLFSLTLFTIMALGIIWLSSYDDPSAFSANFWQKFDTASHIVFFEPAFWQYAPQAFSEGMSFNLWLDSDAIIYSIISLILLRLVDKRFFINAKAYTILALTLMLLPYLWGSMQFLLCTIPLKETGPIIATMWLTILYMILPIGFTLVKKLKQLSEKGTY